MLKNSGTEYGAVTKTFHWVTALIVICLLAVGLYMGDLKDMTLKLQAYNLHKSFGICVLALMVCRICWHIISNRPTPVATLKPWEIKLSALMHYSLYLLLIAMPLTGWLMSSAAGRHVTLFGLFTLPDLVPPDEAAAKIYRHRHEQIGDLIMITVGLHFAAALKHHFFDKDKVLKRMLPVLLILLLPFPAAAQADATWTYTRDKSSITFAGKEMGKEFQGTFERFFPEIVFDPDNLAQSKAKVSIDISTINTHTADRDETARGNAWFDVKNFPTAVFETKKISKTGDKTYEATGNLTIRDVTVPITLPFQMDITAADSDKTKNVQTATMDASITLDRSKFKLGSGTWTDTSVIANEVSVKIHIVAVHAGSFH